MKKIFKIIFLIIRYIVYLFFLYAFVRLALNGYYKINYVCILLVICLILVLEVKKFRVKKIVIPFLIILLLVYFFPKKEIKTCGLVATKYENHASACSQCYCVGIPIYYKYRAPQMNECVGWKFNCSRWLNSELVK